MSNPLSRPPSTSSHAELLRKYKLVNKPVRVQWGRGKSYAGRVTELNEDDGKLKVEYKDYTGQGVQWHDFASEKYSQLTEEEFGK